MLAHILHCYGVNLNYTKMLVADLSPQQMTEQPRPGMNHAAWILGHLAASGTFAAGLLGVEMPLREGWEEKFGMKSAPVDDPAAYPSKEELLEAFEQVHATVSEAVQAADPQRLAQPTPQEQFRSIVPTIGDAVVFMMMTHEVTHIGQLSAWRRALGLPGVLG